MDSSPAYAPDRDLIAMDLDRIASSLSPLIVRLLASLLEAAVTAIEAEPMEVGIGWAKVNLAPYVARMIQAQGSPRLPESVTPQLSAVLQTLLALSDEDLTRLCETGAAELGAWVGALPPVPPDVLAAAGRPLVTVLDR
ncbi:MAG: hypothetical protein ABSD62_14660 [Candidatus Limnocylindrales bacterium]|jgi:hypothetical protein